jgi:hypothetical protein
MTAYHQMQFPHRNYIAVASWYGEYRSVLVDSHLEVMVNVLIMGDGAEKRAEWGTMSCAVTMHILSPQPLLTAFGPASYTQPFGPGNCGGKKIQKIDRLRCRTD